MSSYSCSGRWGSCPKRAKPGPHHCQKRRPNRPHVHICRWCGAESSYESDGSEGFR